MASLTLPALLDELDTKLEQARAECTEAYDQHMGWLTELVMKNTKSLPYQQCASHPAPQQGRGGVRAECWQPDPSGGSRCPGGV